jgi:hypothetical protein
MMIKLWCSRPKGLCKSGHNRINSRLLMWPLLHQQLLKVGNFNLIWWPKITLGGRRLVFIGAKMLKNFLEIKLVVTFKLWACLWNKLSQCQLMHFTSPIKNKTFFLWGHTIHIRKHEKLLGLVFHFDSLILMSNWPLNALVNKPCQFPRPNHC